MRLRHCILFCVLFSCSGGGGKPFTPSGDIDATHAHLLGNWQGEIRSDHVGTPFPTSAEFRPYVRTAFATVVVITGSQCIGHADGTLQADGATVVFENNWTSHTRWRATCTLNGDTLTGTYTMEHPVCGNDTGTVELHKVAPVHLELQTVVEWR